MVECNQYGTTWGWSCDSNAGCCDDDYDCVRDGTCYDGAQISGNYAAYSLNPGGDDDISACDMGIWYDCDEDPTKCGEDPHSNCGVVVGESYGVYAGETGVGEYDNMETEECCGDDDGEFLKENSVTGERRCCNSDDDGVDSGGNCLDCSSYNTLSCSDCLACGDSGYDYVWCSSDVFEDGVGCMSSESACTDEEGTVVTECPEACKQINEQCTVDADCCEETLSTDRPANVPMHCSTYDQEGNAIDYPHCCPNGMYWQDYECVDASPCYHPSDPDYCPYYPPNDPSGPQSEWWGVFPWCVDIPNNKACCYFDIRHGEEDVYYMDSIVSY